MKWSKCKFYKKTASQTTDELGNPVYGDPLLVAEYKCRFTPLDVLKTALGVQTVTKNEPYISVAVSKDNLSDYSYITMDSANYEVLEVIDLGPRWTVLRCKTYGCGL